MNEESFIVTVRELFQISKKSKNIELTDLVPVCSNCHRILHRNKEKMLSIEELKQLIQD